MITASQVKYVVKVLTKALYQVSAQSNMDYKKFVKVIKRNTVHGEEFTMSDLVKKPAVQEEFGEVNGQAWSVYIPQAENDKLLRVINKKGLKTYERR